MQFDFLIIGNDRRFSNFANHLASKKFKVLVLNVNNENFNKAVKKTNSLRFAVKNSKNIICSIPFSRDFVYLNIKNKKIPIEEFLSYLSSENILFGGCFTENFLKACREKNIFVYDYYKDKKFVVYNSIATAEAAIATAILKNDVNMHFSKCLVLGFGNCGKIIANKLKNFCSKVFVCTNDEKEKAWAKAFSFSVFETKSLVFKVEKFNYIFNTIPNQIFNEDVLNALNEKAFILDITGVGIDLKKIKKENINFEQILGIPGKFKSYSSVKLLSEITLKVTKKINNKH